jgi:hypothetical protein
MKLGLSANIKAIQETKIAKFPLFSFSVFGLVMGSVNSYGHISEKGSGGKLFTLFMLWCSYSMKTIKKVGETAFVP